MKLKMTDNGVSEQLIFLETEVKTDDAMIVISLECNDDMKRYCEFKGKKVLERSEYAMITVQATVRFRNGIEAANFEQKYRETQQRLRDEPLDPQRLQHIFHYRNRMVAKDKFPAPVLLFKANELIQVDGSRRLMAAALGGITTMDIVIVIHRRDIAHLIEPQFIEQIKVLHGISKWFGDYQEIIELGLSGKRSYSGRFPKILDFSLFADKTVVEFACSNGLALFEAYYRGAAKVIGFEFVPQNVEIINLIAKRLGISVEAHRLDFNDTDWLDQVRRIIPEWDYSVFLSTYRTKELRDRDGLVKGIWAGSKEGMIFEGHQEAIDTDQFYRNVFSTKAALTNYKVTPIKGIVERPRDGNLRPKYLLKRTKSETTS